jgi:hypothetical protein
MLRSIRNNAEKISKIKLENIQDTAEKYRRYVPIQLVIIRDTVAKISQIK